MRIFKFIFGRFLIITLLVLIQAAAFVALIMFLDIVTPYYYFISLAFSAAGIFIVLVLLNRRINPNYIVPWIVIILAFPVLGVVLYMMFSQNRLNFREKKRYRRLTEEALRHIVQKGRTAAALKNADLKMYGQSRYLYSAGKLPVYDNTYCKYYSSGESFFAALKQELMKAQRFIFMEFFIIEEGMMFNSILDILIKKAEEGVEIRFMYDDLGSIATVKGGFYKKLRRFGINCVKFNKFLPIITAVHNNRDHRKIVVIDGITGFMSGANLADEYINVIEKYGYWKDSAVILKGEAVKSMTAMFLIMFNAQTKTHEDYSPYLPECEAVAKLPGFVQPFGAGPTPLYTEKVGQNAILNIINQAESYVYITTPYLIIDFQLTESLKNAARRGVDVRIITPHIADKRLIFLMTRSAYRQLIQAGVKIYEYTPGFMHSKNLLADDKVAIVGTMNMDYRSLVHHFECGVWIYGSPCISEIKADILGILSESSGISYRESRLNPFQRLLVFVLELFAPLL